MEIPEFTCLCPKTGQPDFATLVLDYVPDRLCVELKSLKLYIWSYRDEGAFHEAVTNRILDDLVRATKPRYMQARGALQRARRHLHHGRRRAPQARLGWQGLNPLLERLQALPVREAARPARPDERPMPALRPINLSIGEPKHPTPRAGEGRPRRRARRSRRLSADRRARPSCARRSPAGSRGATASRRPTRRPRCCRSTARAKRCSLLPRRSSIRPGDARVVCPNPFYQIYEGAALLAGATPVYGDAGETGTACSSSTSARRPIRAAR